MPRMYLANYHFTSISPASLALNLLACISLLTATFMSLTVAIPSHTPAVCTRIA